tara:strand:- start:201 stop:404 length:204 start_codon:yes stop_codon:yes gene_type:complete
MVVQQARKVMIMHKEILEISRNKKTREVVEITTIKGKKNRKGEPYKESVTKHLSLKSKKKKKSNDEV